MFKLGLVGVFSILLFLVSFSSVSAAPNLSALPPEGSTVQIGSTIDYSWNPVSTRDNCIDFKLPGGVAWENWICLGARVGSYSKDTSGLSAGQLSAQIRTKKCSFLGLICPWDYSSVINHNLVSSPALEPQPKNCTGTGSNKRCLDLIPLERTVSGGARASTQAKASWSSGVTGRTVFFDVESTPQGVSINWPTGQTCVTVNGTCSVGVYFDTLPVSNTQTYSIPVTMDAGLPYQNFDLTVEKARNTSPTVTTIPPQAPADYCANPLGWILSWNFSDPDANSFQSAYQITISDAETGRVMLSRLYYSSSNSFAVTAGSLAFNKTYSWKIKVWDNNLATAETTGPNFATLPHSPPAPNFNWQPLRPSASQKINFFDRTSFYDLNPSARKWQWILPAGMQTLSPTNTYNISAKAGGSGNYSINLSSTDSENLTCVKTKTISVGRAVPIIKEIFPR